MKPVKILLDTDMGGDCDDTGALALLHVLADEGECELLAVTHCCRGRQYAGCIDAINRYYGRPSIPVGVWPDDSDASAGNDVYATWAYRRFANRFEKDEAIPDTLSVMRSCLAKADDQEVTLAAIGSFYSLRKLVESGPDEISSLCGRELIARKVCRTIVMGGRFHSRWPEPIVFPDGYVVDTEFNIRDDTPSAQIVCDQWPGELVFCSYEIGCPVITGAELQKNSGESHPVAACYRHWHESTGAPDEGRESWDPATVLYAVKPETGFWTIHPYGRIAVDAAGITTWHEQEGRQTFLLPAVGNEIVRKTIDELLR